MRVAIVAETFRPAVNGVSNSVVRVLEHLGSTGHEALVVAPAPGPDSFAGVQVVRVRSFRAPMYRSVHVGRLPWPGCSRRTVPPPRCRPASPRLAGSPHR